MNFLSYEEPDILDNPEDFENLKKISPELKTLARLMAKDEDEFVVIAENRYAWQINTSGRLTRWINVKSCFLISEYIERKLMGVWNILVWVHPNGQITNV